MAYTFSVNNINNTSVKCINGSLSIDHSAEINEDYLAQCNYTVAFSNGFELDVRDNYSINITPEISISASSSTLSYKIADNSIAALSELFSNNNINTIRKAIAESVLDSISNGKQFSKEEIFDLAKEAISDESFNLKSIDVLKAKIGVLYNQQHPDSTIDLSSLNCMIAKLNDTENFQISSNNNSVFIKTYWLIKTYMPFITLDDVANIIAKLFSSAYTISYTPKDTEETKLYKALINYIFKQ